MNRLRELWIGAETRLLRWADRPLRWADRPQGPGRTLPGHLRTGLSGEREALGHLRRQGFTVVARRWTDGRLRGDLDLVAWEGDTVCFVEVKTRSERDAASPAESAVDRSKRRVLRRLAFAYLRRLPEAVRARAGVRFDLVSVYLAPSRAPECELFRGAFGWKEPPHSPWPGSGI